MKQYCGIFPENQLIYLRYIGPTSLENILGASRVVWDWPEYRKDYPAIIDCQKAVLTFTPEEARALAQALAASPQALSASSAVVQSSPKGTALSLLFREAFANMQQPPVQVFSTLEGACHFLDRQLPEDYERRLQQVTS